MFKKPNRRVTRTFLHCSASDHAHHDNIATMRKWHLARGWSNVGYHFFIRKDGTLEEGRSLEKTPAAQSGHNYYTIAICLHGLRKEKFTQAQFDTLTSLCLEINKAYDGEMSFHGHREVASKACPVFDYKKVLKLDEYGTLGIAGAISPLIENTTSLDSEEMPELKLGSRGEAVKVLQRLLLIKDDGIFGSKTAAAVKNFKRAHDLYPSELVVSHVWKLLFSTEKVEHFD